jgi:hypothetical protein
MPKVTFVNGTAGQDSFYITEYPLREENILLIGFKTKIDW